MHELCSIVLHYFHGKANGFVHVTGNLALLTSLVLVQTLLLGWIYPSKKESLSPQAGAATRNRVRSKSWY